MADVSSSSNAPMLVPSQAMDTSNASGQNPRRKNRRRNKTKPNAAENELSEGNSTSEAATAKPQNQPNNNSRSNRNRGNGNKTANEKNQADSVQPKVANQKEQGKEKKSNKKNNRKRYPWRRFVPSGSVDPITLDPLISLSYPPFALCADSPYTVVPEWPVPEEKDEAIQPTKETEEDRQLRLLQEQWGNVSIIKATEAAPPEKSHPPLSTRKFNLFDGRALAYYMVSQLQFIDPLNRRDLTRDELVNLNQYLKRHGFRDLNVVEAYDERGVTLSSAGAAASSDAGRAQIRQQEAQRLAQNLLNSLFSGNTVSQVRPPASAGNPLQAQYAATQRQEQRRQRQNRNNRNQEEPVDRGIYGSEEAGLLIIDDDANPGLRGGRRPTPTSLAHDAATFTPGTLWSASHITGRYRSHAESNQATLFPPLAANATPAVPVARARAAEPVAKGPSRSLSKITKVVAKTDPKEIQKQRDARELFIKRAAMSNMAFGSDPKQGSESAGLPTPDLLGNSTASREASQGQLLRNQAFASALGVVPSTMRRDQAMFNQGWARPTEVSMLLDEFGNELNATCYPDSLIVKARENMALTLKMEKKWAAFLADDSAASLPLNKMNREHRTFVHEYSDHWRLHTESFDPEPNRYIHCVKLRDTSAPRPLLSEAARTWRGPRPVVIDLSDHALKQTAGQTPREFAPLSSRAHLLLNPRSTDSATPPPGFVCRRDTESEAQVGIMLSDGLASSRGRPKLDLAPRTKPLELAPVEKEHDPLEGRARREALRAERLRLQRLEEEKKQRILESAFASESEEESLKSHDSAEWEDMDEEAEYSGSDEE